MYKIKYQLSDILDLNLPIRIFWKNFEVFIIVIDVFMYHNIMYSAHLNVYIMTGFVMIRKSSVLVFNKRTVRRFFFKFIVTYRFSRIFPVHYIYIISRVHREYCAQYIIYISSPHVTSLILST